MKNYYRRWIPVALGVVICLQVATADAGERCCQRCGCSDGVKMICRPVCTTKYIEVTCWDCVSDVMLRAEETRLQLRRFVVRELQNSAGQ